MQQLKSLFADAAFDDYWRGYVRGHASPVTRYVHYWGLFLGPLVGIALSLFVVWWAVFLVAPSSYLIALATHPLIEKNSNKEFAAKPLWSVIAFFRMMWLELTGRFKEELRRAG